MPDSDHRPDLDRLLGCLRAAADPSRLRLLAVCAQGEWTVSELVQIIGQSQPRISRHLRLLAEAGLLERFREGSWVFYRRARSGPGARVARNLCRLLPLDDRQLTRDRQRVDAVREARRREAERYFASHARAWDSERDLGVDGRRVEEVLFELFREERPESLLDVGTGTGHILRILASHVGSAVGVDISHDMLKVARARLDRRELRNCHVRHADMYRLPFADSSFAAVVFHQVLHFADDPPAALGEAARVLRPGGRLVVVDLLRHDQEWLRLERHHRRLGFTEQEMATWFRELGLEPQTPRRLRGDQLTVVVWTARKCAADDSDLQQRERRAA